MEPFETVGRRVAIVVAIAGGNDSDCGLGIRQPSVVRAVRTAMVMYFVDIDLADIGGYGRLDILIHLRIVATQVSADLLLQGTEGDYDRKAQIVFI